MNEVGAVVERLEGIDAWVRLRSRANGCGRCDEPGGCRSIGLAYSLMARTDIFRVPNSIGAREGDLVMLRMANGAPLRGALLCYGLGTILLLLGALVGGGLANVGQEDLFAFVGAAAGLAIALVFSRRVAGAGAAGAFRVEMAPQQTGCGAQERL